jgi:dihydroorotate dehydrogenase electron transfer subunit
MSLHSLAPEVPPRSTPVCVPAPVVENLHVGDRYWRLRLGVPSIAATARPGQFLLLTPSRQPATGPTLPRPMAIYDLDRTSGTVEILYGVVGHGTRNLTTFRPGDLMTVVGPLGRPFEVVPDTRRMLLVGRGIGTCSFTLLARDQLARGVAVTALLSGRHPGAVIGADFCASLGIPVQKVHDLDGSSAVERVRERLIANLDATPPQFLATCGSGRLVALCQELGQRWGSEVQVSVEAHMACGLGYCHGCAAGQQGEGRESPLVCTIGPVFRLA